MGECKGVGDVCSENSEDQGALAVECYGCPNHTHHDNWDPNHPLHFIVWCLQTWSYTEMLHYSFTYLCFPKWIDLDLICLYFLNLQQMCILTLISRDTLCHWATINILYPPVYAGCSCRCLKRKQKLQTTGQSLWMTWQQRPQLRFQWLRRKTEWGIVGSGAGPNYAHHVHMEMENRTASGSSLDKINNNNKYL